jgi:acetyl esterase/lipase
MFKVHWPLAAALVETAGVSITIPLYKTVPEVSHAVQDALADAAFARIAATHDPARIVLSGDSAGGHMALALALRLAQAGAAQPGKLALFAPWLDVTMQDPEMREVEPRDVMLKVDTLRATGAMFAGERDPASPECSPLFTPVEELAALPPTRIWTGRHDLFIVDSRTFTGKLIAAGVDAKLFEYEGAPHVFMAITASKEAKDVFALLRDFLGE